MQSIRDCAEASGLALHIQGLPMAFHASFAPPGQGRSPGNATWPAATRTGTRGWPTR